MSLDELEMKGISSISHQLLLLHLFRRRLRAGVIIGKLEGNDAQSCLPSGTDWLPSTGLYSWRQLAADVRPSSSFIKKT